MAFRARSLRLKLTLWFVLVFSLIQAVLALGVVLFRRESIQSTLDTSLRVAAETMVDNLLAAEAEWTTDEVRGLMPAGSEFLLLAIRDAQGKGLALWNVADESYLPFSAWEVVPSGPQGTVITTIGPGRARSLTDEAAPLRLVTVPFRYQERPYYFQAAVRDRVLETLLGPFRDLVVIGVPVGVLAALVAAWVIAGRALAPIRRLSQAAQRVSPQRLSERFQVATTDEEFSRLEAELNSALQRLEEGYAAQNEFISNVSHELKTPIAVLLTEAQVTKMGAGDPESLRDFVEKAEREMQRLGRLVESFLTLARADLSLGRPRGIVLVNDLVLECVQRSRTLAEMHGVRLVPRLDEGGDSDDQPMVTGDDELLESAVENLVRNALQHSPRGEAVEIAVRCERFHVEISVHDEGPGIPPEHVSAVFERFRQVPGSNSGGSGLGLAIARHVVELHGGTVCVLQERGCTIALRLPRVTVSGAAGGARPRPARAVRPNRRPAPR